MNYNKYINYAIIGFAISLPVSKAGTSFFSIAIILLWLLDGNFKLKLIELKNSKFILALFSLILFSFISIIWAPDKVLALEFMQKYWHFLVIPVIYTSVQQKYINPILIGFLLGIFASEIVSYLIFLEIISYKNIISSNPSPFMDRMNYSTYLSLAALIILNKIFFIESLKWKMFYFLYFLLTVSTLFINGGRTGQVILIIGIFLTMTMNSKKKLQAIIFAFFIASSVIITAYTTSTTFQLRSSELIQDTINILDNKYDKDLGGFGQRIALWTIGTHIFTDNLLLGTGIGGEIQMFDYYANNLNFEYYADKEMEGFMDFHNAFVQYAVQLGLFGLLIYLAIFYSLFMNNFKTKEYAHVNIIFIFTFILHSTTLFTFHLNHAMVLFVLFASLLTATSKIENKT